MLLLTVLSSLALALHAPGMHLLIGTLVSGRQQTETEARPLETGTASQPHPADAALQRLVMSVSTTTLDALSHQELPLRKTGHQLQCSNATPASRPCSRPAFNLQNREQELVNLPV